MRQTPFLLAVAGVALAGTGAAHALNTSWCGADGMLYLPTEADSHYIGFNDHTICTADSPVLPALTNNADWQGSADCRNVYVIETRDDGTVETADMDHRVLHLRITREGPYAHVIHADGQIATYLDCGY